MDERREEREELAALDRLDADDRREDAASREEWAIEHGLSLPEFVMMESEAWSR